jgi:hypothetical protein
MDSDSVTGFVLFASIARAEQAEGLFYKALTPVVSVWNTPFCLRLL